jgi:hypothetical protein
MFLTLFPSIRIICKVLSNKKVFANSGQTWVFIKNRGKRNFDEFERQSKARFYI